MEADFQWSRAGARIPAWIREAALVLLLLFICLVSQYPGKFDLLTPSHPDFFVYFRLGKDYPISAYLISARPLGNMILMFLNRIGWDAMMYGIAAFHLAGCILLARLPAAFGFPLTPWTRVAFYALCFTNTNFFFGFIYDAFGTFAFFFAALALNLDARGKTLATIPCLLASALCKETFFLAGPVLVALRFLMSRQLRVIDFCTALLPPVFGVLPNLLIKSVFLGYGQPGEEDPYRTARSVGEFLGAFHKNATMLAKGSGWAYLLISALLIAAVVRIAQHHARRQQLLAATALVGIALGALASYSMIPNYVAGYRIPVVFPFLAVFAIALFREAPIEIARFPWFKPMLLGAAVSLVIVCGFGRSYDETKFERTRWNNASNQLDSIRKIADYAKGRKVAISTTADTITPLADTDFLRSRGVDPSGLMLQNNLVTKGNFWFFTAGMRNLTGAPLTVADLIARLDDDGKLVSILHTDDLMALDPTLVLDYKGLPVSQAPKTFLPPRSLPRHAALPGDAPHTLLRSEICSLIRFYYPHFDEPAWQALHKSHFVYLDGNAWVSDDAPSGCDSFVAPAGIPVCKPLPNGVCANLAVRVVDTDVLAPVRVVTEANHRARGDTL